jgi:hypothetical protein
MRINLHRLFLALSVVLFIFLPPRAQKRGSDSEAVAFFNFETVFSTNIDQDGSARVELLRQYRPPRRWKLHCINRQIAC